MAQRNLFSRLQRLFSTDVIIRNQGDNKLKTVDINQIQRSGVLQNNAFVDRFSRIYNNQTSLYGGQMAINYLTLRPQLYSDYDVMDADAIIASALDIISDESTLKNDMNEVLQIRSSNEDIQKTLYNLFYDVLNIEFNLWSWIRQMCKYGDFFLKLEISEKFGVYNVIPFTAFHIERIEQFDKNQPMAVKFKYSPEGIVAGGTTYNNTVVEDNPNSPVFDNYEMAHFRLLTDVNYLPYGRSYIEPARRAYKQYALMKDAMLIHRIVRAPDKRIFYLDIGNIPPNEVENFMQKTITNLKRTPFMDQRTGEYNLKFNMQNLTEDYYMPVRGTNSSTKIDNLPGLAYDGITDVIFLRDELFAALKVPKAFMGYEKDLSGKATLAAQDIRFARTIDRIQRICISELYKIALVHLYAQGYKDEDLTNFELSLTTPSIIYDQEKIALLKEKVELMNNIMESGILPSDWCYENILHLSEESYDEMRDLIAEDQKRKFRLTQIAEEGNDPLESGKSYGTPHDLASMYGTGRYKDASVPTGYDENVPLGRPKEKVSNRNTQDSPFGKDRLGNQDLKREKIGKQKINYKGGSPLALEAEMSKFKKHRILLEEKKMSLTKTESNDDGTLLDENRIAE